MTTANSISFEGDVDLIRGELAHLALPATQDDLLAHLVARHVSVRLLRRLAGLPRMKQYWSVEDICRDAARYRGEAALGRDR